MTHDDPAERATASEVEPDTDENGAEKDARPSVDETPDGPLDDAEFADEGEDEDDTEDEEDGQAVDEENGEDHVYTMTVDLSVIESLGINLYSNAAAVLSELVANAYDADATLVTIDWKNNNERVIVTDDGTGMTVKQLNTRFLKVGYKKREQEGTSSKRFARPFMGRKGIGKLSVFSIAQTVTVYSTRKGESNGFRIVTADLRARIKRRKPYYPAPVDVPQEYRTRGTTLILEDLKKKRAAITARALRKRLARRFDVLSQKPRKAGGFYIEVNGKRITYLDRQELKNVEFIWEFGEPTLPSETLPKVKERFVLENPSLMMGKDWRVRGWFGTVGVPSELTSDDEAGSLKNIMVIARKRPIQEGIVERLDFSRIFGNYVTGQIEADFLDLDDGYDDIATSDRQRLIEDDDRVVAVRDFLRRAFLTAAEQWSVVRPKREAKKALQMYPNIREWVESRPDWQRDAAERLIGTIAAIPMDGKNRGKDKADLFRAGVLAFERIGLRAAADQLDKLSTVTAENLLPLLGAQGSYEAGLWVDILRSRVEAIEKLKELADDDALEKVLQRHLHDYLWLLDPAWERATVSERMEEDLRSVAPGLFARGPDGTQIEGRMDIRYATNSGQHVIIELKRYSARLTVQKLAEQGQKYHTALTSLLKQQQRTDLDIVVVFVLGHPPRVSDPGTVSEQEFIDLQFKPLRGRHVLYRALIEQARRQYEEYLGASKKAEELDKLLGTWGTEFPTHEGEDE